MSMRITALYILHVYKNIYKVNLVYGV